MTERPEKKIAIIGFTASKDEAPWSDPDFELWICNNLWKLCPTNWDRLYDLHDAKDAVKDKEHDGFLRGQKQKHVNGQDVQLGDRELYVFEPQEDWPKAKEFPRKEITEKLGRYFTNSIAWMIAHALLEGVTELHIYGVDMATGGEYSAQRPSCEYMIGVATGAGVNVYIPPQSDLLKSSAMYGAEDDSALHAKMTERRTELTKRGQDLDGQLNQLQTQRAQIQGALETTNYVLDVWTNSRTTSRHDEDKKTADGEPSPNGNTTDEAQQEAAVKNVAEVAA